MSDAAEKRDKVLAIDDDRTFLEFEAEVLERHGIGVVTAGTADEALEVLRRERDISLVLLDVVLEDSSGMDLCRAIKSDESTGGVLVMFVTGQVQPEDVAGLLDAGGDEFSFKPFHIDEFMARVKAMLRQAHRGKVLTESLREAERLADIRTTELDEMRRFADAIVASMASGIVVADGDMRILFANEAFCRMMSLECSGCKGMDLARIVGDKFLSQVDLRVLAGEVVVSGEPREVTGIHHAAGPRDERIMDLRMRPVTYGGTVDTLIVFNDVTDKWLAQEAIRVEAEQLQDVVDAIGAGLSRMDRDGRFLWNNNAFREWFGDPEGRGPRDAFNLPGDTDVEGLLADCFETCRFNKIRWTTMDPAGQKRHFENILAPIRDEHGEALEVLILTLDITGVASRVEQLSLLRQLGSAIQGARDLDKVLALILTCVTAGHGLEFNRAFLFLVDRERGVLEGRMGVGPASRAEAYRVWAELAGGNYTLTDILANYDADEARPLGSAALTALAESVSYPLDAEGEILVRTVLDRSPVIVSDAANDPRVSADFRAAFRSGEFAAVPMVAKDEVIGVILADNLYNGRPITPEHVELVTMFAQQGAMAIDNATAYADLHEKVATISEQAEQIVHSEKLAAIGSMAAHVAHEIRNPLVTVGGFARAIFRHPERIERSRSNAWIITEEVSRLEQMLAGVMDFTKPVKPSLAPSEVNSVLSSVVESVEESLAESNVRMETELDPQPPEVLVDEKQMHQVLLNLVNNAVESMPSGGVLILSSEHDEDWSRIGIKDTGFGVPEEIIPRLFNPFFTTKTDGTGLGLAVTRKIVEDHGGRIEVDSEVGVGTTFTVWLPVSRRGGSEEQPGRN